LIDCKPWPLSAKQDSPSDPVRRLEQTLERRGVATGTLKERTIATFRRELDTSKKGR
jgi:hypothetical protein